MYYIRSDSGVLIAKVSDKVAMEMFNYANCEISVKRYGGSNQKGVLFKEGFTYGTLDTKIYVWEGYFMYKQSDYE